MPIRCASCRCDATTTRLGHPVCWWCADKGLDGVPCEKCGTTSTPADPIEATLDEFDRALSAAPPIVDVPFTLTVEVVTRKGKQGGLF